MEFNNINNNNDDDNKFIIIIIIIIIDAWCRWFLKFICS